jgi:O-antigen/teichoic acid export membrane protein
LGRILPLKLLLGSLVMVLLAGAGLLGPWSAEYGGLLVMGGLLLVPEAAVGLLRAFANGLQRMEVSGSIDLAIRATAVLISWALLEAGRGVSGVLLATVIASFLGTAIYAAVLWHWRMLPRWQTAVSAWRADLAQSFPFALTAVAAMLYARVDLLLLGAWRGEAAAGLYGAAYRLWEAVGLLPASLLEALFPEMSRLASAPGGRQRLSRLFRNGTWLLLGTGLVLAAAGVLLAGVLVPLVFGSESDYAAAILPFRLLVCGLPAMFVYLLSGYTLYTLDRQRRVTATMLAVGAANIALNLYAIPRWSFAGAAAVALLSEWLLAAALYAQARRTLLAATG